MKQNIEIISQPKNFGQEEGTWAIPAELALEINLGKQVVILGWVSLLLRTQKRGKIFCKRFFTKLESWFTIQGGGSWDLSVFLLTGSYVDYSLCCFLKAAERERWLTFTAVGSNETRRTITSSWHGVAVASIHAFTGLLAVWTISTFWTPCFKRTKQQLGYVATGAIPSLVISTLFLSTKIRCSFSTSAHFWRARSGHWQADGCLEQRRQHWLAVSNPWTAGPTAAEPGPTVPGSALSSIPHMWQ